MVDLGSVEPAEGYFGGARPVPAGYSRSQETATEVERDREMRSRWPARAHIAFPSDRALLAFEGTKE